jgi:N-acetylglucosamine kinase-like BadF-type ATPase
MRLIADSGSTKTDWILLDDQNIICEYKTVGLNPYLNSKETIMNVLRNDLLTSYCAGNIKNTTSIDFYGAGCSVAAKSKVIKDALHCFFPFADIEVSHDLLGAAKAACGSKPGIAVILGTGSNSCYYDGENIVDNVISLGYILGDEGSGCYMGKKLLQDFLNKDMPEKLQNILFEETGVTAEIIFENIYKKQRPNKYMASFSEWIAQHLKAHVYLQDLVKDSFEAFFKQHIIKYKNHKTLPLNIVGSVGYAYLDILTEVANSFDCKIGNAIKSPLQGLISL